MNVGEIKVPVKFSKRWYFWPLFYAVQINYRLGLMSLSRASSIAAKGIRMEIGK